MGMAIFYPFIFGDHSHFPERAAGDHRLASFVGAVGSDQLIPGPVLDTSEIDDIHSVLMLIGLKFGEMQAIRPNDFDARRFGWIGLDPILSITPDIVFALAEPVAREFLLDLKSAAEMIKAIRPSEKTGCMIEIILPRST
jgi:hypothetical protein